MLQLLSNKRLILDNTLTSYKWS